MNLYFIHAETDDGENLDLMVRCDTVLDASKLWKKHFRIPRMPHRIWIVNPTTIGVLDWNDESGLEEMVMSEEAERADGTPSAAALEMLAALEFFQAQWEDVEDGDIGEAYVRAVEAIKKARG